MISWNNIWRASTQDWIYARLDGGQGPAFSDQVISPETAYLNVFLKSARIVDVRKGLKRFYGAVHSHMRLPRRSQKPAEFSVVTTPSALKDVDAMHLARVIQINRRLLGPVPYLGGDLEVQVALLSVASSELTGPYLSLLETLSKEAGVAFMNVAIPFARPIVEGINLLTGASLDSVLEVAISTTMEPVREGYYAIIRAPKEALSVETLAVDPTDHHLIGPGGQPLVAYPYMLLELRADSQRSDWFTIPAVCEAYTAVQEAFRTGAQESVEQALQVFRRIALTCDDLLPNDADRLAHKIEALYKSRRGQRTTRFFGRFNELPDLDTVDLYADE